MLPLAISPFVVNFGANVDEDIHDVDGDELFVASAVFSPIRIRISISRPALIEKRRRLRKLTVWPIVSSIDIRVDNPPHLHKHVIQRRRNRSRPYRVGIPTAPPDVHGVGGGIRQQHGEDGKLGPDGHIVRKE